MFQKEHRKLKVALIDYEGCGGISHYSYNLSSALVKAGAQVFLFSTIDYELEMLPREFTLFKIFSSSTMDRRSTHTLAGLGHLWRGLSHLARLLRAMITIIVLRCDIVHVQWLRNMAIDLHGIKLLKVFGTRIVYTAHNILPHDSGPGDPRSLYGTLYKLADGVVVHGRLNTERLKTEFPDVETKIKSIDHGNYTFFNIEGYKPVRRKSRIQKDTLNVLFFGMIRPYKGLDLLIKCFPAVMSSVPEARLIIAGKPKEDFLRYDRLITALGLENSVVKDLRYIPLEEVSEYFETCDIVVLPYRNVYESGIVQLAYAFGKPVVATRVGVLEETIEDGKSGIIIDPGDIDALGDAIIELLLDAELRKRMGGYGVHLARTRFSWQRIASETLQFYHEILNPTKE